MKIAITCFAALLEQASKAAFKRETSSQWARNPIIAIPTAGLSFLRSIRNFTTVGNNLLGDPKARSRQRLRMANEDVGQSPAIALTVASQSKCLSLTT